MRSDKKMPRTPITARLIADMLEVAGADRFMTIDVHAGQIQGFFRIPGDVLTAFHLLRDYVQKTLSMDNLVVSTIDLGFAKGGRNWARDLGLPLSLIEKNRTESGGVSAKGIVGNVAGKNVLLVDDECDTAGSLVESDPAPGSRRCARLPWRSRMRSSRPLLWNIWRSTSTAYARLSVPTRSRFAWRIGCPI
jgi:ribose-phosphate pyrophosphokinase